MRITCPRETPGDAGWFVDARFGLFVHWGVYAVGARDAWLKTYDRLDDAAYDERCTRRFDPDLYDPAAWAAAAVDAGMRYVVVTAKHHDGFCLFRSAVSDYTAYDLLGRDLLRELVDACRAAGLRIGFYYSLLDWHHPDFLVDRYHPARGQQAWGVVAAEARNEGRDWDRYVDYCHAQVAELLTGYGPVDVLWLDFSYADKGAEQWRAEALLEQVRRLAPGVLVNDRAGLPASWYDVTTPEQVVPPAWPQVGGEPALWETCQTLNGAWGYARDADTFKSPEQLVLLLAESVSKGGNLLLNVGPTARGEIDGPSLERLAAVGAWLRRHEPSVRGCTQAPDGIATPAGCLLTYDPARHRLFVHVTTWPVTRYLELPGLAGKVRSARLLHDGSDLPLTGPEALFVNDEERYVDDGSALVSLPFHRPDVLLPVVDLVLEED